MCSWCAFSVAFFFTFCYLFCPLSSLLPFSIFPMESHFLFICVCLFLTGFLVYYSSQEELVGDIPGYIVIDYGLISFIGALLPCKITQGYFFSLGTNLLVTFIQEWPSLGLSLRDKQCYHSFLRNPAIIAVWFKHLSFSVFFCTFVLIFVLHYTWVVSQLVLDCLTGFLISFVTIAVLPPLQLQQNAIPKPERAN